MFVEIVRIVPVQRKAEIFCQDLKGDNMSDEIKMVFTDESYIKAMEDENKKLKKQVKFLIKDLDNKVSELNMLRDEHIAIRKEVD